MKVLGGAQGTSAEDVSKTGALSDGARHDGSASVEASDAVGVALTGRQLKQRLIIADAVALLVGLFWAFLLQETLKPTSQAIAHDHLWLTLLSLPGFVAGAAWNHLWIARANERPVDEARNVVRAVLVGVGVIVALSVAFKFEEFSRLWAVLAALCPTATVLLERQWVRRKFAELRRAGQLHRRILIVGTDAHAIGLLHSFQRNPELGYEVVGFVGDDDLGDRDGVKVVGQVDDLLTLLGVHNAVGVVVSAAGVSQEVVNHVTRTLTDDGFHVAVSTSLRDIDVARLRSQQVDGRALIYVEPTIRSGWRAVAKRVFDITLAGTGLVVTAPVIAAAALAIKLTSRGPVFFHQVRVGQYGETFRLTKLRTMCIDAEARLAELRQHNELDGPLFKMARDPRITPVGRILRKLSIDELPQLWNVITGAMSMVGPRPMLPAEADQLDGVAHRLRVLPGVTGLWQVSGRSSTSFESYLRLDSYYVDNWSLLHDVKICVRTVGVVLTGRGAA